MPSTNQLTLQPSISPSSQLWESINPYGTMRPHRSCLYVEEMMMMMAKLVLGGLVITAGLCSAELQVGFYKGKCGIFHVEAIVATVVTSRFISDPTVIPALIRLQYHDCFVGGCDASILIDGVESEKAAGPNDSVRGYDVIDDAKSAVESLCPGVVSCADLIVIAARDAVFLGGAGRYEVETGRRDAMTSMAQNVIIPGPSIPVPQAIAAFAAKGFTPAEMVLLLGAHSVGVTHCSAIMNRLYNFSSTDDVDPAMEPSLADTLALTCHLNAANDTVINLDQSPVAPFLMDNSYYKQLMNNRGVLKLDQDLVFDRLTEPTVVKLANGFDFPDLFGAAMVKLGSLGVLNATQGEIRRCCRATNPPIIP